MIVALAHWPTTHSLTGNPWDSPPATALNGLHSTQAFLKMGSERAQDFLLTEAPPHLHSEVAQRKWPACQRGESGILCQLLGCQFSQETVNAVDYSEILPDAAVRLPGFAAVVGRGGAIRLGPGCLSCSAIGRCVGEKRLQDLGSTERMSSRYTYSPHANSSDIRG